MRLFGLLIISSVLVYTKKKSLNYEVVRWSKFSKWTLSMDYEESFKEKLDFKCEKCDGLV